MKIKLAKNDQKHLFLALQFAIAMRYGYEHVTRLHEKIEGIPGLKDYKAWGGHGLSEGAPIACGQGVTPADNATMMLEVGHALITGEAIGLQDFFDLPTDMKLSLGVLKAASRKCGLPVIKAAPANDSHTIVCEGTEDTYGPYPVQPPMPDGEKSPEIASEELTEAKSTQPEAPKEPQIASEDEAKWIHPGTLTEWAGIVPARLRLPKPHIPADLRDKIPEAIPGYIVTEDVLPVLTALALNQNLWIHGMSGTGKSEVVAHVASMLGLPLSRVNFDSEISRTDIMGGTSLRTDEDKNVVTAFKLGAIAEAIQHPGILLLDEIDAAEPSAAYCLIELLEGNGLTLLEDGGRFIRKHEHCHIIATGNTNGRDNPDNMFLGVSHQSTALLNRFGMWMRMEYMDASLEVSRLIDAHEEACNCDSCSVYKTPLIKFVSLYREAFAQRTVTVPLSIRGVKTIIELVHFATDILGMTEPREIITYAVGMTITHQTSASEAVAVEGGISRLM